MTGKGRNPKKNHVFSIVLDRPPAEHERDALGRPGPGGAEFAYDAGRCVARFHSDEQPLVGAVLSAVGRVEAAGLKAMAVESNDLVSLKDIAARTGRTYESVRLLAAGARGPGGFPPVTSGSGWALYSWTQVSEWFARFSGPLDDRAGDQEREIAICDHLVRARALAAHFTIDIAFAPEGFEVRISRHRKKKAAT